MTVSKLYKLIADRIQTAKHGANIAVAERHVSEINELVREFMPSGSGFDAGTQLDLDASNRLRLVFTTSFHHMDEHGGYDGWTEHKVTVTPNFGGFDIKVSGRNRNDIKEYVGDAFEAALLQDITHVWDADKLAFDFWLKKAA